MDTSTQDISMDIKNATAAASSGVAGRLRSAYHFSLALFGALLYGLPSQQLRVIAVTGTKGKSSTTELINAIFEEAGEKTALINSIRIKVGDDSKPNTMRMSMPGRFYLQKLMARALRAECSTVIIEMTSEGARQHRHRFIELDALVFTNLSPEHIESHGSLEKYADAKFEIAKQLLRSGKRPRIMAANSADAQSARYLTLPVEVVVPFSLEESAPHASDEHGGYFTFEGARIDVHLPGDFSLRNAIAAAAVTHRFDIAIETIARAIGRVTEIPGRGQRIEAGQDFDVVVDYAHTPDSLEALYDAYKDRHTICVLGSTGGGRDTWKRPVMGGIADKHCDEVILTNEDPYDENPSAIIQQLQKGMHRAPEIIMDRRAAIARAIARAKPGGAVLITGKGTDPNIAEAGGKKTPWSDARVAREELDKLLGQSHE